MLMIGELTFCLSLAPLHITGIHAPCTCLFVTYLVHITHLDLYLVTHALCTCLFVAYLTVLLTLTLILEKKPLFDFA